MPNVTKATNERPMTIPRTTLEVPPVPSSVSSSTVLEFVMPNSGLLVHTVCLLVVVDVVTVVVVVDFVVVFLKNSFENMYLYSKTQFFCKVLYTVKSQVLTCLVYKNYPVFTDCLWKEN